MQIFNDGWQFAKGEPEGFAPVDLPHDWLIADTADLYESGTGWYKRDLGADFWKDGQRVLIYFDGVYMDSTLFVNGRQAGEWKYGYTAFEHDITGFLHREGPNTLLLKIDYRWSNSRWYTGAGIYRDVFLNIKNPYHFITDGIYVATSIKDGRWHFEVDAEVEAGGKPYELRHTLLDADGEIAAWDIDNPHLYTLRSELLIDGEIADTAHTRFGFRTILFDSNEGFFLNGRHLKLNGVCLHHDLGLLGAAVHRDAIRRQLTLLRDMGVNAIRTAHNPPAKAFMELTDEMGFLVMSEFTDTWRTPKNPYDYARFFDEWVEKDVVSWIRRDRNHPSVILWSVGNEIRDTHIDAEDGAKTLRRLIDLVAKHDHRKNAPVTLCSNYMPWENTQKCADIVKVIGYNYAESLYEAHHAEHPDWVIYGSETCATTQSRGIYHFPLSKSILSDDDLQCSVLGNSATSWGAKSVEACIHADRDTAFSPGQFIWVGQDHIGEPTPYKTKNSYLGHIDTAGFPKDSYYIFKAAWTDYKKDPMVHVYPYWDFSPGQLIDVRVCSNAPKVELFLDGESLGTAETDGLFVRDWRIPYRPGTLRAVAFDECGVIVAEAFRKSFGNTAALHLSSEIIGELIFTTITAVDMDGDPVENACDRVRVSAEGGTLLGLDNGDSTDYDQYQTDCKRLFSGKLLAITKRNDGETPRVTAVLDTADIPIRKIELTMQDHTISAEIFPHNATYKDLCWRLTDAGGIDSYLGSLEVSEDGRSAVLKPRGDGEVYIRCSTKNGREHITLISQFAFNITGMGKPFIDPYDFVSGGLCSLSNVELTNGNDRGVATLRNGESHVGFKDLDFGAYGSDEFTIPLFSLEKTPFYFGVWEGMPLEGGTHLFDAYYDKGYIWNTYQEEAYKLPKRLTGVTTLCFVFRHKVHIKGFQFTKYQKAFQTLAAAGNDVIYGDSFTVNGDAVENIGNNVSIVYNDMDFGDAGTERIELKWRSALEKNSIQLIFDDGEKETRKMIEVPHADAYTSAVFPLNGKITGNNTVTLVFLPGCNIDLEYIRFK